MNRSLLNIESLLEHLDSKDVPEDTIHRYELRRELLCSRYFGDHCARSQRWNRLLTFTMPLITGGVLVVVFTFVGASLRDPVHVAPGGETIVAAVEEEKANEFVDTREPIPMYEVIKFVPTQTVDYILMH
jgi:hypothetical protein